MYWLIGIALIVIAVVAWFLWFTSDKRAARQALQDAIDRGEV